MIIQSLLDTDLYKLTMMQAVLHQFPWVEVAYEFKCRNDDVNLTFCIKEIHKEIEQLCTLRFSDDEIDYLRQLPYLKEDFIQFLKLFQFNRNFMDLNEHSNSLKLTLKGPWLHTILFEVPLLAIINETYFRICNPNPDYADGKNRLLEKINLVENSNKLNENFKIIEFGTRRRFSREWQAELLGILKKRLPNNLIGTSNVLLAKKYNLKPIGTMAHEWLMAAQALESKLVDSQKYALEHWVKEYRGDLGIALSDVVGFDAFLNDFDLYFSKIFDGCRHDSGDPFEWGERLIAHYQKFGINPMNKTAVFSDGLTFQKALQIARHFDGRIKTSFGIGTNLTNDFAGIKPLNIVIKMSQCQNEPVAKISDSPGKETCHDKEYLHYLHRVFQRHN
jgi:nicotinate phosphoribosyltransferase